MQRLFKQYGRAILWLILFILLVKVLFAVLFSVQLMQTVASVQETVETMVSTETSYPIIRDDLQRATQQTRQIKWAIWPFAPLLRNANQVPIIGADIAASIHLLEIGESFLTIFELFEAPLSTLILNQSTSEQDLLASALQLVAQNQASITMAESKLAAARLSYDQINLPRNIQLQQAISQLEPALQYGEIGVPLMKAMPNILGINEPHHILVLLQNADELRPTGGWITSYAYATIENGQITTIDVAASHGPPVDRFETRRYGLPPFPFREYMDLRIWLFRDANWSPDFPTSATKAATLFTYGTEQPVDTVIAVNQYTLQGLLQIIGSVELENGQTLSTDNAIRFAQDSWLSGVVEGDKKRFIRELVPILIEASIAGDYSLETVQTVLELGRQKLWYAYSTHTSLQHTFETVGWDGSIDEASQDYIYLVDANVGYDKANLNMRSTVNYHLSLSDPLAPFGLLSTTYTNIGNGQSNICRSDRKNLGNNDYLQRAINCNTNYLRLYLPKNSELLESPYFPVPDSYYRPATGEMRPLLDERNKEVWGGVMVTSPQSTQSGRFVYTLQPSEIYQWVNNDTLSYRLLIQKQSGKLPHPLTVTVDLPQNWQLLSADPQPTTATQQVIAYDVQFDRDFELELQFQIPRDERAELEGLLTPYSPAPQPTLPPRLVPTQPPVAFPTE